MPIWPSSRLLNSCLPVATAGGVTLGSPTPAIAQDVGARALAELVRQQSQEIADLRRRLAAVEESKSPAVAGRTAPPIVATTSPAEAVPGTGAAPVFKAEGGKVTFHPRGRLLIDFPATGGSNAAARNYAATGARAIRIGARLVARSSTGFGAELARVAGPLWLMGEAGSRRFEIRDGANSRVTAWSVAGGYTLVCGRAPYNRRSGSFIRPRMDGSVLEGGPGAIELVGRYERHDYDRPITAGSGREILLGANWYLTQYLRLISNFILWRIDAPGAQRDAGHTGTMRMELVF